MNLFLPILPLLVTELFSPESPNISIWSKYTRRMVKTIQPNLKLTCFFSMLASFYLTLPLLFWSPLCSLQWLQVWLQSSNKTFCQKILPRSASLFQQKFDHFLWPTAACMAHSGFLIFLSFAFFTVIHLSLAKS